MHDAVGLRGYAAGEQVVHLVEQRSLRRVRRVHLRVPAAQLSLDVAGLAHHVAQADRDGGEGMQRDEYVDEVPGALARVRGARASPASLSASTRPSTNSIT